MNVTVSVTQDDIDHGIPEDGCACPIARAARRAIPSLPELVVGIYELFPSNIGRHLAELPDAAMAFIDRFDQNGAVEPFEFTLDIPDELIAEVQS